MAIIDWDQFNENFQYYDKEVITEVVNIFVNEYEARINTLQKNIDEKDYTNLAFNAHSFKSVIGNYMASKAYEPARKLEELAHNNSEEGIQITFAELKRTTKELHFELKDYLQKSDKS
jgi:HPt (histidine-containing phosphotransfer) domain-containing protein